MKQQGSREQKDLEISYFFSYNTYSQHSAGEQLIPSDKQFGFGKIRTFPALLVGDGEHKPRGSTGKATG